MTESNPVNTETLIAESEEIYRNDRSTSRHQDTSGIAYGEEAVATPAAVIFRWGTEGGYAQGALAIPWPDILKHAPTAELVAALRERDGVASHAPDRTAWASVNYGDGISWGTKTRTGDVVIVVGEVPE